MVELTPGEWLKWKKTQNLYNSRKANKTLSEGDRRRYQGSLQKVPTSIKGYNTKRYPSLTIAPEFDSSGNIKKTSKGTIVGSGELHHGAPINRIQPLFDTVKTKKDLERLLTALVEHGVATGDDIENLFDLPKLLHDSSDPRAIHQVERLLGLDAKKYIPDGGTIDDAIKAVPDIAKDVTESKNRIRKLQFGETQLGDGAFTRQIMMRSTPELSEDLKIRNQKNVESKQKDLKRGRTLGIPEVIPVKHADDLKLSRETFNYSKPSFDYSGDKRVVDKQIDKFWEAAYLNGENGDNGKKSNGAVTTNGKTKSNGLSILDKATGARKLDAALNIGANLATGNVAGAAVGAGSVAATEALKSKAAQKFAAEQMLKIGAKRGGKTALKLIPGVDIAISAKEAWDYLMQGKLDQAGIAALSGAVGWVPIAGDAVSAGLDLTNTGIDIARLHANTNNKNKKKLETDTSIKSPTRKVKIKL
tara:strand:- start:50 stop:1471 length:1422 start_codon:yes stop_codon:yes gene_type:complete